MAVSKPLGMKCYGSIGHLPLSRLGPADRHVPQGQADICLVKTRDKHDKVIVQEKLDGSCTGVALVNDVIIPLVRSGYPAISSPYLQHHLFHDWVISHQDAFRHVLQEGERIVGEWCAQAHSTIYNLSRIEPWFAFDIMQGHRRLPYNEFCERVDLMFQQPHHYHTGPAIGLWEALERLFDCHYPCDEPEGLVFRVERRGEVDFLAKYVRPNKVDGLYLDWDVWNKKL